MVNVCMLCDKEVNGPLTAAGLCLACSESLVADASRRSSAPPVSSPMFPAPAGGRGMQPAAPRRGLRWGVYLGSVAIMLMGTAFLSNAMFNSTPRGPVGGSGRGRALGQLLRSLFGERGEEAVMGLVILAVATGFAALSMCRAGIRGRIVGITILGCMALAIPGTWLALVQVEWREAAWQRATAAKVRPSLDGARESATEPLPAIRDKVVVWDYTIKGISPVQKLLPARRQGQASDRELTFVAVLSTRDKAEKPYTDGTPAHRRTLTVAVVNWPEGQVLGVWPVAGDSPPFFTSRPMDEKGPVIGDTTDPLKRWITETVPSNRQTQQEFARLQGAWVVVRSDAFGAGLRDPAVQHPKATLRIKDRTFARRDDHGTIFIDPTKEPKQMDLLPSDGPALRGIYTLDGDTLTFCHSLPGTFERPRTLQGGLTAICFVYKREP